MLNKHKHKAFLNRLGVSDAKLKRVPEGVEFTDERLDLTEGIIRLLKTRYRQQILEPQSHANRERDSALADILTVKAQTAAALDRLSVRLTAIKEEQRELAQ